MPNVIIRQRLIPTATQWMMITQTRPVTQKVPDQISESDAVYVTVATSEYGTSEIPSESGRNRDL
jgi:hypothetical protein